MYFRFESSNSKDSLICSDKNFLDELDNMQRNSFTGDIKIFVSDEEVEEFEEPSHDSFKFAGKLEFHAHNVTKMFDEDDYYNNDLYVCMDAESQDQSVYYNVFLTACKELIDNEYKGESPTLNDLLYNFKDVYLMTIDDFCIENEFRKRGIASLILNNLSKLMRLYYDIEIMTAVGLFNPHDNEPEEMLDIQKKCYGNCGFTIYSEGIESYFYKNMIVEL